MQDSLEPKLFGIGVESYTAGSLEFYLGYAVKNGLQITLDTGHLHPTELVSDKISCSDPVCQRSPAACNKKCKMGQRPYPYSH